MAAMSPLAGLMMIAFFLLIVVALLVWALLVPRTPRHPRPAERPRAEDRAHERIQVTPASNDEVRGAKAPKKRAAMPDDAFERFLRSGRDDDR
jgi:hypothetical protein